VILAAAYLLWLYQRVFFGKVTNPKNEKLADLTPRELLTFTPLIILALWIGLYPKPFFEILEPPVHQLVVDVRGEKYFKPDATTNASSQPQEKDSTAAPATAQLTDKGVK
jgi:NADH-quinone oxidoreductase subunit M